MFTVDIKKVGFLNFFLLIFFSLINDIPFPFSLGNECEQQYAAIFDTFVALRKILRKAYEHSRSFPFAYETFMP